MKAAVFRGAGRALQIESLPDPTPGPAELVIEVGRCGICGTDLHRTEGHEGFTWAPGSVLGHEAAGEVVAVGSAVEGFRIGDRVTALPFTGCGQCASCLGGDPLYCDRGTRAMMGGFAQYMRVGFREAVKLPASLSLDDGALVEPLAVGLHAVETAQVTAGARVVVIGVGPIGLATIFWARRAGAEKILAIGKSPRREAFALALGATGFLVPSGSDTRAKIASILGGPPDVVFEAVGLPGLISQAIEYVRPRGTVVVQGLCMQADSIDPALALRKEVRVLFSMAYSLREYRRVVDVLDSGQVEPRTMITDTVSLDALPETFEALRKPSAQCKVLVRPSDLTA